MGNLYDVLIDLGYEDVEDDFESEMDLDRDVPEEPSDENGLTLEDWIESMIGEPEYLGDR
jgi:hypothetical protein